MAEYIDREAIRNRLYDADAITMNGVAILNNFPAADVELYPGRGLCSYYAEKGGLLVGFEKAAN